MNRYPTAAAFKQAVEDRLRSSSSTGADFARRRQLLVFHRFLARLVDELGDRAMLKGGLVVELRVRRARTTKDIDLRVVGRPAELANQLRRAARLDLGDFMAFTVTRDAQNPEITSEGMAYSGQRYRIACEVAGRPYGQPFGLDVAFADAVLGEPDVMVADDVLGFAGIAPPTLRVYPIETHIAEKLHAYTLPRKRPNSRVKDLPDIALLASVRELGVDRLRSAIERTFTSRKTHPTPEALPAPPEAWTDPYGHMADEDELPWRGLGTLGSALESFLNPLLGGIATGTWIPSVWHWRRSE